MAAYRSVRFVFRGRLVEDSFERFARARAARLSLDLDVEFADRGAFACVVGGPSALVGAFEMACSLGPLNCIVLAVEGEAVARDQTEREGAHG